MTKTALVTGSAGFIGRNMVRELVSQGYEVMGCDLPEGWAKSPPTTSFYAGDARDLFRHETLVFDLVVHAAYHVGGRAAIDGVNTNFAKNLQLDSAMFEWAVRTKQTRVLYFSSSAVYPKYLQMPCPLHGDDCQESYGPLREDMASPVLGSAVWTPPEPGDNYGFAKLTGERLAENARWNGLPVSVVRPFSGYGEDQSLDYPFPSIVERARAGDLSVWGPPGQCRDWIHVDDVVKGALAVVESETTDPVNLCTGVATEMGELMLIAERQAMTFCDDDLPEVTYLEDKPTGVFYRVGDPARFNQYYAPKISLEEGIRRALAC